MGDKTAVDLRLLFTTHAVYTKFFIQSTMNDLPDLNVVTEKLLQNQKDIGKYIGGKLNSEQAGEKISQLLTQHILSASGAVSAVKTQTGISEAVRKVFQNSREVALYLSSLNPQKLPFDEVLKMFNMHNQYVIDMTTLCYEKKYEQEYDTYDHYYLHMMDFSDTIANALKPTQAFLQTTDILASFYQDWRYCFYL